MSRHHDGITIESLRPGDAEARYDLGRQAFNATAAFDPDAPQLDPEQMLVAYDGGDLLAGVVTLDFVMTWGGRPVPCGGVSGVVVRPEARGRGLARRLLHESFQRMGRRGQVVSALYPTTASLYRGAGYEVVCWYGRRRIPLGEIPTGPADDLEWRRVELVDPAIGEVERAMVADLDGWFRPDPSWRARNLHHMATEPSVNRYAYVGRRGGSDVAAVVYKYTSSEATLYDLEAEMIFGIDGGALSGALGFLAVNGTTAGEVRTALPAPLLARVLPQVQRCRVISEWPLMLRVVDLPGAVEARGWPAAVTGRVDLQVVDDTVGRNAGPWVLEVDGGRAAASAGGSGSIHVTANDLAVLYAGADPRALYAGGRLAGSTPADRDLLAAAFVSSPSIAAFF